jgi:hypothetical protein
MRSNEEEDTGFEQLFLEAENRIAKAISRLFDMEDVLDRVCSKVKRELDFDYVNISLVVPILNTIDSVYGIGVADNWANLARHYLGENPDLRDIQADIVKTGRTEIIAGWDTRFDSWLYKTFNHERLIRIFTPIIIFRDINGNIIDNWFENYNWSHGFAPRILKEGNHTIIERPTPLNWSSFRVIGTIEAGYQNRNTRISHEKSIRLAQIAAKEALEIRQTRLRYVLELIAENAKKNFES